MYDDSEMIGYVPVSVNNYHYINNPDWVSEIFSAIKKVYNQNIENTLKVHINKNPNYFWSSTSNTTFRVDIFNQFMKWFDPLVPLIKESKNSGHAFERAVSFFYITKNKKMLLTNRLLQHIQMDSHKTQGHQVDYKKNMDKLLGGDKETITLYNHFHYGDIFYARVLINLLNDKFNINFYHQLKLNLLNDIENVTEFNVLPQEFSVHTTSLDKKIVNTWIGSENNIYLNKVYRGCCLENYLFLCKKITDYYGINFDPNNYEQLLPTVNFNNLKDVDDISKILDEFIKKYKKIVLISNGDVKSGQSINFNFSGIINHIASTHKEILFLVTEEFNTDNDNIIATSTITNKQPDLLEISYISTKCDVIIGRASGPYTYSLVKENLLNPNKTFISFNHTYNEGKFYDKQKSKYIWSNNYSEEHIINTIKTNI